MASIKQRLTQLPILREMRELFQMWNDLLTDLTYLRDRLVSQALGSAGLVINGAGLLVAKNGNAFDYIAGGVIRTVAANTAFPALAGTINQNNFGGWCFYGDSAGNITAVFMGQAATLAGVTFPATPAGKALIGYVRLNPTAANFVGGTTALDAANTNAVYVNTQGAIDPSTVLVTTA